MKNYTISFKYWEKIVTPKQNNTLISTEFDNQNLLNALIENNVNLGSDPDCIIIFRPNINVESLSLLEKESCKEFKCPITIKNELEEKTFNQ